MVSEHRAQVTWSAAQVAKGLPAIAQTTDPSWLVPVAPDDEAWSLICRFEPTPLMQGNPTMASVRFLVAEAPHERLKAGTVLRLFERGTGELATVELID